MKRKKKATANNKNPYLKTYNTMQKKVEKARSKLKKDLKSKNIDWKKVKYDSTYLMLLLGECNYFSKECMHCKKKGKWR